MDARERTAASAAARPTGESLSATALLPALTDSAGAPEPLLGVRIHPGDDLEQPFMVPLEIPLMDGLVVRDSIPKEVNALDSVVDVSPHCPRVRGIRVSWEGRC